MYLFGIVEYTDFQPFASITELTHPKGEIGLCLDREALLCNVHSFQEQTPINHIKKNQEDPP